MSSVVILGAGNVAHHLTRALISNTVHVKQVFNRTLEKAEALANANNIRHTNKISEIEQADIYIIACADSAIEELSHYIKYTNCLVVHTSGSMPISTLKGNYRKGVLYPLQTFSKGETMRYNNLPFLLEAEQAEDELALYRLSKKISEQVYITTSEKRLKTHMAAVWVCNFVNQLYQIGDQICQENQLEFDILRPLINETAKKIERLTPKQAQTGPAKRGDDVIIQKHENLLQNNSDLLQLYQLLTKQIKKTHDQL